ncbi:DmsC/YnfH family molybdoenzyme membrane anchor subunit [Entomohabitans teleogrylli]|uniref:DmsC/YnfH family molybdoenzyme membrane anchor subunit n=1 Tax=Entomohabitans teleogrylli TaxID=1384589 RepID=UPI00073D4508|nr:DmsC/YnfH family molybdoenzyme membrane anchor subunit [Entomohabitans teleogrylli]
MGNGWLEWPLVIFTVFGQCVVGAFIVMSCALLTQSGNQQQRQRVLWAMLGLWILMGLGFIASVIHLGSPLRAFNSLNRVGSSALSNEIASGSLFFAAGGFWWLLSVLNKLPAAASRLWMSVTMVLGVVFVWMMARVYNSIDTVPTWHSGWTTAHFFLTALIGGPLLGGFLLRFAGFRFRSPLTLPAISCAAVVLSVIAVLLQSSELATIQTSLHQASALVPDYGAIMSWRVVLLIAALAIWFIPLLKGKEPGVAMLCVALLFVVVGELLGRGLFYGLHMTVGLL